MKTRPTTGKMGVEPKIMGKPPTNHPMLNRGFPLLNRGFPLFSPSILGVFHPYFFGNHPNTATARLVGHPEEGDTLVSLASRTQPSKIDESKFNQVDPRFRQLGVVNFISRIRTKSIQTCRFF